MIKPNHSGAPTFLPIYALAIGGQVGSFLSYFALTVSLMKMSGSGSVAYSIVFQTIPAILLAMTFVRIFPRRARVTGIIATHFARALLLVYLSNNLSTISIFAYFLAAAMLRTYSGPAMQSLISEWVPAAAAKGMRLRLNGLMAAAIAVGPPLGGVVASYTNLSVLLLLDAAIAVILVFGLIYCRQLYGTTEEQDGVATDGAKTLTVAQDSISTGVSPVPALIRTLTWSWLVLILTGACINSLEFAVFELRQLTQFEIGLAIGAWGLGGFLSAAGVHWPWLLEQSIGRLGTGLLASLFALVLFHDAPALIVCVGLCGFFHTFISSTLQSKIQIAVSKHGDDRRTWASLHRGMSLINLAVAGVAGYLLFLGPGVRDVAVWLMPVSAGLFLLYAYSARDALDSRAEETPMKAPL